MVCSIIGKVSTYIHECALHLACKSLQQCVYAELLSSNKASGTVHSAVIFTLSYDIIHDIVLNH